MRLRERPASTGSPSAASSRQPAQEREVVFEGLAEAETGINQRGASEECPRARKQQHAPSGRRAPRRRHRRNAARPASCGARPACASGRPQRRFRRRAASAPGAERRHVVHERCSGSDRAAHHHGLCGCRRTPERRSEPARRSMSGITRRSSSDVVDRLRAPGRVDSPPTSTMAAPSATSSCARASAAGNSRKLPAVGEGIRRDVDDAHDDRAVEVEQEAAALEAHGSQACGCGRFRQEERLRAAQGLAGRRPDHGFRLRAALTAGLRPCLVPVARWLRHASRHDVLELLFVDGLST